MKAAIMVLHKDAQLHCFTACIFAKHLRIQSICFSTDGVALIHMSVTSREDAAQNTLVALVC